MSSKLFWNIVGYTSALLAAFSVVALVTFVVVIFTSRQFVYLGYLISIAVLILSTLLVRLAARKTRQPAADFFLDLFFWL